MAGHIILMSRLSLQVFYLWRHVLSTAPPSILWWSNLEILFAPLHRSSFFIGGLRCQAIQTEHGPHIAERTQKAVYIVRCLCGRPIRMVLRLLPISLTTIWGRGQNSWPSSPITAIVCYLSSRIFSVYDPQLYCHHLKRYRYWTAGG
jgi:hypothetical protein